MRYLCVYYTAKPLMMSNNFERKRKIESVYSKKERNGMKTVKRLLKLLLLLVVVAFVGYFIFTGFRI